MEEQSQLSLKAKSLQLTFPLLLLLLPPTPILEKKKDAALSQLIRVIFTLILIFKKNEHEPERIVQELLLILGYANYKWN